MAIKTVEKSMRGHTYKVTTLAVDSALDVFSKLVKCLGPSLGALGKSLVVHGEAAEGEPNLAGLDLAGAMELFAKHYNSDEIKAVLRKLAAVSTVCGEDTQNKELPMADVYDSHFAGNFGGLFDWARFGLEVQFGDFFGELIRKGAAQRAPRTAKSASLTTSAVAGLSSGL